MSSDGEQVKVLVVVEDDPDIRRLIRFILGQDERIDVSGEASTAHEAIELAKREQPGGIILDHLIEGDIMGLEAAPLIKQVAPATKILLFTALDLHSEAAQEPAVDEFLLKVHMHELLDRVRALLGLTETE